MPAKPMIDDGETLVLDETITVHSGEYVMPAKPMIDEGGTRVRDKDNKTIGFVYTEPVAGAPEGSLLQRWILRSFQSSYRFEEWKLPLTRASWKQMVTTPAPSAGGSWGDDPAKGLWVKDAIYVVAQSTPVTPVRGKTPVATFPKGSPSARLPPGALTSRERLSENACSIEQIIIDYIYVLTQSGVKLGYCFGTLDLEKIKGQQAFTSSEYILTLPPRSVGHGSRQDASVKSLDPGPDQCDDASRFHEFAITQFTKGARYDVIGCNYYKSETQPPGPELYGFLFD